MRLGNLDGRLALLNGGGATDVATASDGRFGPDVQSVYERWDEFVTWASTHDATDLVEVDMTKLGPPVPRPPQVFAIGLNYTDHAQEANLELPDQPMVFTKFPASITGPYAAIGLPAGRVDWEVELVAVVGRRAEGVTEADAWDYIAGLTAGQDLSERDLQTKSSKPPQYNLGKSYTGFAPIGPVLVTPDELADRDDLAISCSVSGVTMQEGRTSDMIFKIAQVVAYLSRILPLLPGDCIFTGTPAGIGAIRKPPRLIGPTDVLETSIEGIGQMRHTFYERRLA